MSGVHVAVCWGCSWTKTMRSRRRAAQAAEDHYHDTPSVIDRVDARRAARVRGGEAVLVDADLVEESLDGMFNALGALRAVRDVLSDASERRQSQ